MRPTVLLAGVDDALARRVAVALSSLGAHLHRVPWAVVVAEPAWVLDSEAVIVQYQGDRSGLECLAGLERWSPDQSRGGAIVVLCTGGLTAEVEPLLGRGISRLVRLDELDLLLCEQMSSLLGVARRYRIRAPVRLRPAITADIAEENGTTENLSASGMLVSCLSEVSVGSTIRFEISIPGQVEPIRGTARIVRTTDLERDGVRGVGARIQSFLGSDRSRFDDLLSAQPH